MPRSRRSASPIRRPAPERMRSPPARTTTHHPAPMPQRQVGAPAAAQGSGLMGQMAATAGGVAIGSVVGHGLTSALFGGGSSESKPAESSYQEQPLAQPQQQYAQQPQQQQQVCSWELQQFLNCAQAQQDISVCDGFNEALKQCKRNYGVM